MKVENKKVYRIVPFDVNVEIGQSVVPSKWDIRGEFKQRVENELEENCPKDKFPSRSKCLFVCFSKENADEWAYIKYMRKTTKYKLLTLEVSGDLYWLKADTFNFLNKKSSPNDVQKACIDYWNSEVQNEKNLLLDKAYEGLFVGENRVIEIEDKEHDG